MRTKTDQIIFYIYILLSCLFTAIFVFEVPRIVFYAPVLLFTVFVCYNRIQKERFRFSAVAGVLAVFTVVFIIFNYDYSQTFYYQSYIHIQAVMMFLIGYNFFQPGAPLEDKFRLLDGYLMAVSWMYIAYITITFIHYYYFTPADLEVRFYYSIWYDFVKKPATVISMSLVIPFTYGAYSLFFSRWYKKLIGVFFIAVTVGVNFWTGTRTLLYLAPFVVLFVFLVWVVFAKKKIKVGLIIGGVCVAAALCAILIFHFKRQELAEKYAGTVFGRIFNYGLESARWRYSRYVLEHFSFSYFGSGVNSAEYGTPHNIWLYIYDYGGIVSFLIYCVFTVMLLVLFIRFLLNKHIGVNIKCLITTVFGVMFAEYMLEPFILPLPSFYILTLFVFGLFAGLAKYKKPEEAKP